jgi:2-hydroxycyclohexanecarboxyl-CoA dehydrogenase
VGQPSEVAAAAVFLASTEASFITGQVLSVSGGLTMVD